MEREHFTMAQFAKQYGKPKVTNPVEYINSETGEPFRSWHLAFLSLTEKDDKGRPLATKVYFAKKLGKLTKEEILQRQHSLQIMKNDAGYWMLCNRGMDSWQDLDIDMDDED